MKPKNYIKGFDSLRAISIIMVLITHLGVYQAFDHHPFLIYRVWHLFSGLTGVQVFFTISGFLITRILLVEKIKHGKISFRIFYIRRFIRLLPALFVFYGIYMLFYLLNLISLDKIGLLFSITYLYNFIPNVYYSGILGHMWSLGVEEQFYIIWPLFISLFTQFRAYIFTAVAGLMLCIIAVYWLPAQTFMHHQHSYNIGAAFQLERWFVPAVLPILFGSVASAMLVYEESRIRKILLHVKLLVMLGALCFLSPLYLPEIMMPFKYAFQSLGVTIFLLLIVAYPESKAVRLLHVQPLIYIGKISYGIYVFQGIFLMTGPGSQLSVQQFPLNIVLTLLVAVGSYELVEKKCLRWKNKFSNPTLAALT